MYYYEVAPTKIVRTNAEVFTYHSPDKLEIGNIVTIPIGKSSCVGVIIRTVQKPQFDTRAIFSKVVDTPLPAELVETARWVSDYYTTPLATVLSMLLPRGITKQRRDRNTAAHTHIRTRTDHTPTPEQEDAITTIQSTTSTTSLLFGPTGSGKTLVYKELAKQAIATGRSVIILVPEIALTSQLVDEFMQDFPEQVLLTHSKQTEAERHIIWKQALDAATPRVAIGPRSALFLPLQDIGLIVADEMHEPSYKQEQAPRYSALRVATMLAHYHKGKAVLGSATPPVTEYYTATQRNVPIVTLPQRVTATPRTHTIDMTKRNNFTKHRFLSDILLATIQQSLSTGKQVLIFHNRRGSAATTLCETCGWTATDPSTGVPLTLHSDTHQLISHLTGYSIKVPTVCPTCGAANIIHKGIGTKLIESELSQIFPNKKIVRFDGDSGSDHSVDARYKELYDGTIDIIIGTQVIAKGIDLPHLNTVGIVQADAGLALPDFTSSERVFQLISQAVGRVGRGHTDTTNVIVQSYQPEHPAVRYGVSQQYLTFYDQEIAIRQRYKFPPFSYLLKCTCIYKTEAAAIRNAKAVARSFRDMLLSDEKILGPAPAFYEQQNGTYRWQLIVQSPRRKRLATLATTILPANNHWQHELDPGSLL